MTNVTRSAGRPAVLLVDLSWDVAALLAADLLRRGWTVHVATEGLRRAARSLPLASVSFVEFRRGATATELLADCPVEQVDVVVGCTEQAVLPLLASGAELPVPVVPRAGADAAALLDDRPALLDTCASLGVAVPESRPAIDADHAVALVKEFGLPVVVKGSRGYGGAAVFICNTAGEVGAAARQIVADGAGDIAVQRYYPGEVVIAGCVARDGVVGPVSCGRALRRFPLSNGPATEVESMSNPQMEAAMRTVAARLEWTGPLGFDFVADDDGSYLLMDVNPRLWGATWGAERAGLGVLDAVDAVLRDEPMRAPAGRMGVRTRIFPKYVDTGGAAGLTLGQRTAGLRDAPWLHRRLVARELAALFARRVVRR